MIYNQDPSKPKLKLRNRTPRTDLEIFNDIVDVYKMAEAGENDTMKTAITKNKRAYEDIAVYLNKFDINIDGKFRTFLESEFGAEAKILMSDTELLNIRELQKRTEEGDQAYLEFVRKVLRELSAGKDTPENTALMCHMRLAFQSTIFETGSPSEVILKLIALEKNRSLATNESEAERQAMIDTILRLFMDNKSDLDEQNNILRDLVNTQYSQAFNNLVQGSVEVLPRRAGQTVKTREANADLWEMRNVSPEFIRGLATILEQINDDKKISISKLTFSPSESSQVKLLSPNRYDVLINPKDTLDNIERMLESLDPKTAVADTPTAQNVQPRNAPASPEILQARDTAPKAENVPDGRAPKDTVLGDGDGDYGELDENTDVLDTRDARITPPPLPRDAQEGEGEGEGDPTRSTSPEATDAAENRLRGGFFGGLKRAWASYAPLWLGGNIDAKLDAMPEKKRDRKALKFALKLVKKDKRIFVFNGVIFTSGKGMQTLERVRKAINTIPNGWNTGRVGIVGGNEYSEIYQDNIQLNIESDNWESELARLITDQKRRDAVNEEIKSDSRLFMYDNSVFTEKTVADIESLVSGATEILNETNYRGNVYITDQTYYNTVQNKDAIQLNFTNADWETKLREIATQMSTK
ncbi:MAG: hypothetical protein COX81_04015 [Candidatus Magasanikbacteria bacterium CG_4_10_14_0_2_um_filter_37_12]|uniref:Uncharacterized protein n=1 Tax=Candidatus Magasanikbacteria bacterium CG_4_10_14_0_2_um_filter_37_12 TaxID=1974637 RepID=A0A2M7V6F6_9BACT|nr:MAG: hypothetical protein COX81_04015 [Candidatus Magasanikbacteria bacterium CG_4_10_14_0_2_um_filter_37_12]